MESFGYSPGDKENHAMSIGLVGVMIFFIGTFLPFGYRWSIFRLLLYNYRRIGYIRPEFCFVDLPILLALYVLPINCLYRFVKKEKPIKSAGGVLVGIFFLSFIFIGTFSYASWGLYIMIVGAVIMIVGAVMMPEPFKHKQVYPSDRSWHSPSPPPPPLNHNDSRNLSTVSCPNCGQTRKDNDVCFYCGRSY